MHIAIFANGLRALHYPRASAVAYCGYIVKAGTRHEAAADSGMAHFLEHMSFKGTARRSSTQISQYLERVGGDLNAYTSKQETSYCATVLQRDLPRALDLLTDIVFHSTYPQAEINKEVEVIIDEIESYLDSPSDLIFDEFESMIFANRPLGRDILGDPERLRSYTTADAQRFAQAHYRPDNAVFYYTGSADPKRLFQQLAKRHQTTLLRLVTAEEAEEWRLTLPPAADFAETYAPATERRVTKNTTQAHVMLGAPTFGLGDERAYALVLLNNLLGGLGMSSRLYQVVRERHGLVYSIDSYVTSYLDAGCWCVYFGCDKADVQRCLRLVRRELHKFATKPLSEAQLRVAKQQIYAHINIGAEQADNFIQNMAKIFANEGVLRDLEALKAKYEAVTASQIQQLAAEIYDPQRISTLIYT